MKNIKKIIFTIPFVVLFVMSALTVSASVVMAQALTLPQTPMVSINPMDAVAGTSWRLDKHSGQMLPNATPLMAYKNDDCTGQENHYICAGDWYDLIQTASNGNVELRYPITVPNGNGDETEIHWFNGVDWKANSDGTSGHFTTNYDETKWYNRLPLNAFTYTDDHSNNGGTVYISNNDSSDYYLTDYDLDGNRELMCGSTVVMKASANPVVYCYYNHSDRADADYSWGKTSQGWGANGLIQGTNTVCLVGMNASGNFTGGTGSVD